ncbi:hypothetical protein [Sphingomonas morindae]|uniref:Porin domain-containing protein n=1 Tax=Sphingomonas morindae TaxID=1541170 RepID=A0ABY4XBK9_9SPHN|nr:hypothetical protein [Sphingomonas morindae]USI74288.1 hypothetical protein LHA26_07515 [Sphingomonas morindae]
MMRQGGLALALMLAPALVLAGPREAHRRSRAVPHVSHFTPSHAGSAGSIGSFTPAAADPRLAMSFGRAGLMGGSGFRFTPSSTPGSSRRVTVAVRARANTPEQAERQAMAGQGAGVAPSAYNLGVALGWKRFAVTSDYAKVDLGAVPGSRESADIALSYAGRRWSTRLALAAERALGDVPHLVDNDRNVSVDLGGSYSINNRLDVTGGVRYRVDRDRFQVVDDSRRDSQAIYIGTAFRF